MTRRLIISLFIALCSTEVSAESTPGATAGLTSSGSLQSRHGSCFSPSETSHPFQEPGHYHELTFSCFRRLPLLTDDACRVLLSHSIEQAMAATSLSARGLRVHADPCPSPDLPRRRGFQH